MIRIEITKKQIERAKTLYDFHNLKTSFTKGESQIYGALGEIIVMDYYNISQKTYVPTKDYDLIYKNKTVDVKTKRTTSKPLQSYLSSIALISAHQRCDEYVFVRILNDMTVGWICGWISKADFFTKGFFAHEGQIDPSSSNNFKFTQDCINLPISQLKTRYNGNLDGIFIKKYFNLEEETPFIVTKYKRLKEKNEAELNIRLIYDIQNNKLTIQEDKRGNLFNGYVKTKKQFIYLFNYFLEIPM